MSVTNFIDNANVEPLDGTYLDNWEPATGRVYGRLPRSKAADTELAVQAALRAFPAWSKTTAQHRSELLVKVGARTLLGFGGCGDRLF